MKPKIATIRTIKPNNPPTDKHLTCDEENYSKKILSHKKPSKLKKHSVKTKNGTIASLLQSRTGKSEPIILKPLDTLTLQRYASLAREIMKERVLQLQDIAHQLALEEEHEFAKGKHLEILK